MHFINLNHAEPAIPNPLPNYDSTRVASDGDATTIVQELVLKNTIQFRSEQIAKGWTSQQRAERRRAGADCRAWLLRVLNQSQIN
jgi:hypothetical protein